ncbi:MAG: FtsW/RodA/SpoVE family cell cycle protein [Bacteroidaceae bacterium]|nr:FtsW/RodA/SpoVE family cell cycle protein [Bacteroidaceae bacterium]MBQ3153337.1 FtsW/RodA/SpoVE family cell cycle protein [Bacteroidaceae bacterium]MBQ4039042.1 FtsW/RodA/SpoVE family cell cycle protein [Bacteroidaceae bacterium]MBR6804920.1 FtsW/RodA/SpoVE family cell cycle protein [Bacteroidaceae bacterium]
MSRNIIKRIFKGDTVTWILFAVLCAISLVEVFSAASRLTIRYSLWGPLIGHAKFLLLSIFTALVVHNIPMEWFKKAAPYVYALFTALLIYGTLFGETKGDATRWISIAGHSIQPSEFARLGLLLIISKFIADWQEDNETAWNTLKKIIIVTLGVCIPIVITNLSTTLIILSAVYMMLMLAKLPRKLMAKFTLVCMALAIAGATTIMVIPAEKVRGTPFKRIETWQNRISKYMPFGEKQEEKKVDDGKDDQRKYANIAIASSGIIFGKGPGNSEEREYLPEAYSDLIYAIIIEEWGLIIGCVGLLILYLTLLFHTGQIAKNCDDPFAAYLIMGAALLIGIQAMIHMSISTGLFPISGQPLPLISRGGSSLVVNSVYIGMILSISRYAGKLKAEKEKRNYTPAE